MKKLTLIAAMLMVLGVVGMSVVASLVTASNAMAATFELRDCFESPPLSEQSANNLWTFHSQDHNGAMLPLAYEPTGYGNPSVWELIGPMILSGDLAWVSVWSGPESIPTFDGVFMHPGITNATAVVFHAPEAMSISEIKLWSEGVGDSGYVRCNGFSVTVNSVISGVTKQIGSFTFSFPSMVETIYTHSTIALQKGDMIEILYGNNSDNWGDNGNVNIFISGLQCVPPPTSILFEDFDDSSGFTVGGGGALYWGTAPLSGTASLPSHFLQGSSSQCGTIFYGSLAKEYQGSPAATMTIALPDLSGYTNLKLTVALAAPDGNIWENTHRDSLHIIGGTTISPPVVDCSIAAGCLPVTGAIDSFLPTARGGNLKSQVYAIELQPEFQDFEYPIDSSLKSITFAFASTGWDEVIGIDSVRITGDPIARIKIDIKPGSCPNPLNVKSKGVLPVAIAGTNDLDVTKIDPASIRLSREGVEGEVAPLRWSYEDNGTPFEGELCGCHALNGDGYTDLSLKFDTQALVVPLKLEDVVGNTIPLILTGNLKEEFGGTPIRGQDCIWILK